MKKSLLAIAAMTAFAGAAQAQSSVTVYGIMDVGYINQKSDGSSTAAQTEAKSSFLGQSAEQTSRLGFKGTEDLGGGNQAFFTIETGLQPSQTTLSTFNNRQSFAGLSSKGLGKLAIGTQNTPIHTAVGASDPGQQNNMPGNVIYASSIAGTSGNSGTAAFAQATTAGSTSDAYTVRTQNTLSVQSDRFAGFGAGAMYTYNATSTDPINATITENKYTGYGLTADFSGVKNLYVVAAYQALKSSNISPTVSLTSPAPAIWSGTAGGTNTQDNQTYAAATYDFGILKGFLQYVNRKAESTLNANYFAKRTAQQVGVRSYITPTIEGWASWGNGKVTAYGLSQPSANFVAWQVGANYYLSKRTNLYGIYGANNLSSSSASSSVPVNTAAMAVGVRHTF
jgi:predicted porin